MKLTVLLIICFSFSCLISKDIVVTKDGNIFRGKIEKYDEVELIIKLTEDNTFRIPAENILSVDFDNNLEEASEKIEKYNHAIGVGLFYPTDLNIDYNLIFDDLIAEISIGSDIDWLYGIEIGFKRPFYFKKDIYLAPFITIGHQYLDFDYEYYDYYTIINSRTYVSIGVNFNLYGFNIKFGLIPFSSDGFPLIGPIEEPIYLKIGYLYHF